MPIVRSFPGDEGWLLQTVGENATGIGGTKKDGAIVRFYNDLLTRHRISWYEVPISAASYAFSPESSFTACVHEVALNGTDLCLAPFWVTSQRTQLASFPQPLYNDVFVTVTIKESSGVMSLSEAMQTPFTPFTWQMWFALVGTLFYVSIVMWILEGGTNDDDFPEASNSQKLFKSVLVSFMAFWSAGDLRFGPKTFDGWITISGLAFCIMVLITNYQADVTADLIGSKARGAMASLEDGITKSLPICGLEAIREEPLSRFPNLSQLYHDVDDEQSLALALVG